ncbi:hypothetical protein PMAYCL1PPCAC_13132, partial [Pristionchus mayeri]
METANAQFGFENFANLVAPSIALVTNKGTRIEQAASMAQAVSGVFLGNGREQQPPPSYYNQYGGPSPGYGGYGGNSHFGSPSGQPSSSYFGNSGNSFGSSSNSFGGIPSRFGGSSNSFGGRSSSFGGSGSSFEGSGKSSSSDLFGPTSSFGGSGGLKTNTPSSFDYEDGHGSFGRKREVSSFGSRPPPEVVGGTGGLKKTYVNPFPNRPQPSYNGGGGGLFGP